jgi:phosphoglycerate kinase
MIADLKNKKALVRVDFNVPIDSKGEITDDTRIRMALSTIRYLLDEGAAVILMSHLGRPLKKKLPDGSIDRNKFSLRPVADHLGLLLNTTVEFIDDCIGSKVTARIDALQPGQIILLENTRFYSEETGGDEAFAKQLTELGDVYINDAFGAAHREHASTATVARFFERNNKSFGFLMEKELKNAQFLIENPRRPFVAIIGGAKVSDKIGLLDAMLDIATDILVGGAMAYTFLKSLGGKIGNSLVEDDKMPLALELLKKAKAKNVRIYLPQDSIIAKEISEKADTRITDSTEIEDQWMGLDIGPGAVDEFSKVIATASTILWNGPMGVFEMAPFSMGTLSIARAVAGATAKGAYSLVGGGDSVAAVNATGLDDQISFISTGGGAMLELLEGKKLPGIAAIME